MNDSDIIAQLRLENETLLNKLQAKELLESALLEANNQLAFQNKEKEKRAAELVVINEELKSTEQQLKSANSELEAFSYSVSHDLRAPLRAINGYAQILKEDYEQLLDNEAQYAIQTIVESAKQMGQLIDDLLKFSQLARLDDVQEDINMQAIVENSIHEISKIKNISNYQFNIQSLPNCRGDYSMLKQVWFNLIDNAIKYSAPLKEPIITIGCNQCPSSFEYFVKDNGVGFDMAYAGKLFGVFQRLHRKEEFEGTGLGLSLVKRIVEKHQGTVKATSTINEGSCFYFSLPKTLKNA